MAKKQKTFADKVIGFCFTVGIVAVLAGVIILVLNSMGSMGNLPFGAPLIGGGATLFVLGLILKILRGLFGKKQTLTKNNQADNKKDLERKSEPEKKPEPEKKSEPEPKGFIPDQLYYVQITDLNGDLGAAISTVQMDMPGFSNNFEAAYLHLMYLPAIVGQFNGKEVEENAQMIYNGSQFGMNIIDKNGKILKTFQKKPFERTGMAKMVYEANKEVVVDLKTKAVNNSKNQFLNNKEVKDKLWMMFSLLSDFKGEEKQYMFTEQGSKLYGDNLSANIDLDFIDRKDFVNGIEEISKNMYNAGKIAVTECYTAGYRLLMNMGLPKLAYKLITMGIVLTANEKLRVTTDQSRVVEMARLYYGVKLAMYYYATQTPGHEHDLQKLCNSFRNTPYEVPEAFDLLYDDFDQFGDMIVNPMEEDQDTINYAKSALEGLLDN